VSAADTGLAERQDVDASKTALSSIVSMIFIQLPSREPSMKLVPLVMISANCFAAASTRAASAHSPRRIAHWNA